MKDIKPLQVLEFEFKRVIFHGREFVAFPSAIQPIYFDEDEARRITAWLVELTGEQSRTESVEKDVRMIHQMLKRGEATQDHGLEGNLHCIIDHLADTVQE